MYDTAQMPLFEESSAIRTECPMSTETDCYGHHLNTIVAKPDIDEACHCAGCGTKILDRYFLLVAEQRWHLACLRCSECDTQLDSQATCFVRDSMIFCKQDYHRRYSIRRCARCHVGLSSLELVMRSRDLFYHVDCFTCFSCNKPLSSGDTYGIHDNQIFCHEDYEHLLNNSQIDTRYCNVYDYGYPDVELSHEVLDYCGTEFEPVHIQKSARGKRRHMLPSDGCFQTIGLMTNKHGDLISRDKYSGQPPRQKRVRTSFKHTQLRTMKSYFTVNHNPDAKDLKELSKKTQLSKRVLQVWFQNARAKYRRSASKHGSDTTAESGITNVELNGQDAEQLLDLSKCGSPSLSDVSTNQSLTSIEMTDTGSKLSDSIHDGFSDCHESP